MENEGSEVEDYTQVNTEFEFSLAPWDDVSNNEKNGNYIHVSLLLGHSGIHHCVVSSWKPHRDGVYFQQFACSSSESALDTLLQSRDRRIRRAKKLWRCSRDQRFPENALEIEMYRLIPLSLNIVPVLKFLFCFSVILFTLNTWVTT